MAVLSLAVAGGVGCSDDDNKNNDGGAGGTGGLRADAGSTGGSGGFATGGAGGQGGHGAAGGLATGGTAGTHTGGGGSGAVGGGGGLGKTGGAGGLGGHGGNGGVGTGGAVTGGGGQTGGNGGVGGSVAGASGSGGQAGGAGGAVAALSDGQIAAIMLDANSGEMRTANIANLRSNTMAVRDFASQLILDHGAANDRLNALSRTLGIAVTDSPQRQMVATQGTQVGEQLWMATAGTFDQTFLQAQVTLHTSVLNLLDNMLLPAVQADELKMELQTERTAVAQHLTHAQTLLAGGNPDAGAP